MVHVQQVSKRFGATRAVDAISFEVHQGENFILLGTSGCGKTTTLRMINRLIEPTEGTISINGKNIMQQPAEQLRRNIGYVLQRNSLFPHYTVYENIAVVPQLLQWDKEKTHTRITELIAKLHLTPEQLHLYPQQLSGGQAQRVNLARALVANPDLLLMDEPFSALDTLTRSAIRKEFGELDELKQKTILMVTHDVQEAFEMGDRICLMDKGRIVQTGTPAELLFRPANDFVRDFFSDAFLQLSFTITCLQDLWPYLETEATAEDGNSIEIAATSTIGKAVELIKDKNDRNIRLSIRHTMETLPKQVSWEGLLSAFSRYKTNS